MKTIEYWYSVNDTVYGMILKREANKSAEFSYSFQEARDIMIQYYEQKIAELKSITEDEWNEMNAII